MDTVRKLDHDIFTLADVRYTNIDLFCYVSF